MSLVWNWSDEECFNFLCGFQAALRGKDLGCPLFQSETLLNPVSVGGYSNRGIALGRVYYRLGNNDYIMPVFTHDIDVEYSGFTLKMNFPYDSVQVTDVVEGEFGTISQYGGADIRCEWDNTTGELLAIGIKANTWKTKKNMILFFIRLQVDNDPSETLELKVLPPQNINGTSLLKYDTDGVSLEVIQPLANGNGYIYPSGTPVELQQAVLSTDATLACGVSPRFTRLGGGWGSGRAGEKAAVGYDAYYFPDVIGTRVKFKMAIRDAIEVGDTEVLSLIDVVGSGYFEVDSFTETHEDVTWEQTNIVTHQTTEITAPCLVIGGEMHRTKKPLRWYLQPELAFTAIVDVSDQWDNDVYMETIALEASVYNEQTGAWDDVGLVRGLLHLYPEGATPGISRDDVTDGGQVPPGIMGHGTIYSSQDQLIYINIDGTGISYPIYLEAGYNEVDFWIPFESSEATNVDLNITVSAQDYIEIEKGFTWDIYSSLDAPTRIENPSPIEQLTFNDLHDVLIIHHAGPISDQDEIDDLPYEDFHDVDLITAPGTYDVDEADSVEFEDLHSIDIQYGPRVYNLAELDDLELNDLYEVIKHEVFNGESRTTEEASFEDFVDIDM